MRAVMQKVRRYTNKPFRDLCHDAPRCFLQASPMCRAQSGYDPCHSNRQRHGRGTNYKTHDCYVTPGCAPCHYWLDYGPAPREEKEAAFMNAWEEWMLYVFDSGLVRVA